MTRRVWITRAEPQAHATAPRVLALGFEPVVAPVLETRALDGVDPDLDQADALAFTSAAAVAAFAALSPRRDLAVFAVGDATAEAARAAGFAHVRSAGGDVEALASLIARADPAPGCVLNPTAREPAADLPALLAQHGIAAQAVVVYETVETALAAPPPNLDAVLIHSAMAARRVAALLDDAAASGLELIALSAAAAAPLSKHRFRRTAIAAAPNEAALLEALGALEPPPPSAFDDDGFRPPSQGLGGAFWAMIVVGFLCALAGLGVARLGPKLFPAHPPAHAATGARAGTLGKRAPPG